MKLILKQYLSSLKERDELDVLLPDLLSQMGLNVFSRPGRGTRQDGVDVAAVGSIDGGPEKIYLFSIKAGDLTRAAWDGDSIQSLRPSLNEIRDAYLSNRLPHEHREKDIVICLCFGGDIQEQVRPQVEGYIRQNITPTLTFEQWNGDRLAQLILKYFLREDMLPEDTRPQLRKALALLDEPEASFGHFKSLVKGIAHAESKSNSQCVTSIRQLSICLWILFAWARDTGNLESAYLSAEFTLLYSWESAKTQFSKKTKAAKSIQEGFGSILNIYQLICSHYLRKILPHTDKQDGLSFAVHSSSSIDVNLKLFDVMSRLAMAGLWSIWGSQVHEKNSDLKVQYKNEVDIVLHTIKGLILNNPTLFLPLKDDHAIDIFLALLVLSFGNENREDVVGWLSEIADRAVFAYGCHGPYPCILRNYRDLLDHPKTGDEEYRKEVTEGSILYPTIALWAALLKDEPLFEKIKSAKEKYLDHCNFQVWYPDETTEEFLYRNQGLHGAVLSNVPVDKTPKDLLDTVWRECEETDHFDKLSARMYGFWPLILLACRHYRIPVPMHFTLGYRETEHNSTSRESADE
jgi:hypothetical protein